jgi:hypothetical protein
MRICMATVMPLAAALAAGVVLPAVALSDDCPTCGTVSVSVAGANGEAIRGGAYLALVAKGDSFLRPVAEVVRDTTAPPAVWQVQPGTYVAACFARGFSPELSSAEVRSGETTPIVLTVKPMLTLTGRVLSKETGRPIEGATVMPSVFSTPKFTTKWSDLAQHYVRSAYGAATGRQGEFSIFVAPKSSNAFVFEAPGAASTLVNNLMIGETARQLPDVILPQAGALQVIGSFPPSASPEKYVAIIYSFTPSPTGGSSTMRGICCSAGWTPTGPPNGGLCIPVIGRCALTQRTGSISRWGRCTSPQGGSPACSSTSSPRGLSAR